MPHLFRESSGSWDVRRLDGDPGLAADLLSPGGETGAGAGRSARLIQADAGGARAWALIVPAGSGARVNGGAVAAGLRVLADRDEICAGGSRYFFSAESIPEVVPFPESVRPVFCGRCRLLIPVGNPTVCCPNCGIWHHQGGPENRLCWTYAPACSCCNSETALDAELKWYPEE